MLDTAGVSKTENNKNTTVKTVTHPDNRFFDVLFDLKNNILIHYIFLRRILANTGIT